MIISKKHFFCLGLMVAAGINAMWKPNSPEEERQWFADIEEFERKKREREARLGPYLEERYLWREKRLAEYAEEERRQERLSSEHAKHLIFNEIELYRAVRAETARQNGQQEPKEKM